MIDYIVGLITTPFVMMLFGILMHYIKKVIEQRATNSEITLRTYWYKYPYKSIFSILSALAGFGALYGTDELTRLTAFSIGYMADSIADILTSKTNIKFDKLK